MHGLIAVEFKGENKIWKNNNEKNTCKYTIYYFSKKPGHVTRD